MRSTSTHPLCLIRLALRKTQAEFAEYLGIPKRNIENWETEKTNPPDYLMNLIRFKIRKNDVIVNPHDNVTLNFKDIVANLKTQELCYGSLATAYVGKTERLVFQKPVKNDKPLVYCLNSSKVTVVRKYPNMHTLVLCDSKGGRFALTYEEFNYATGFCCD